MPDLAYPADGGTTHGYLAVPGGPRPDGEPAAGPRGGRERWPGVVVIHEAFGLTDGIRRHADRLAGAGYLAFAPDLFTGKPWVRCVKSAITQLRSGSGPAFTAIEAARAYLASRADCSGTTGVIGFCMGGGFALLCAPRDGFSAVSVNYGQVPDDPETALEGACPVVGSFGARDPMGTKPPERLEKALTALGVPHDVKVYGGAGHRFMNRTSGPRASLLGLARMAYHEEAAEDSWRRILAFFGDHLRG
ncbi:MAG TPA: dienelactone hydrolase family protein [Streptosporangiaceae bacterium]|jgi:carboxymethylenebutenolidase|nr:dienelactone hydrolase family protein [Streptosporangiaceae bacterium]